jgi:hypothetical protein
MTTDYRPDPDRITVYDVPCPTCHIRVGGSCRTHLRHPMATVHLARLLAAAALREWIEKGGDAEEGPPP